MKKIYFSILSFCAISFGMNAQNNAAISACLNGSNVQISFDNSMNCAAAPGDLSAMTDIGFHSGADSWSTVIPWDDAGAITAQNDGAGVFTLTMDPAAYYGVAASTVHFVYNGGPADPANPWASEGKDDDGAGGCADFMVDVAALSPCSGTSVEEVSLKDIITVSPNPANESTFFNLILRDYKDVQISVYDITGKLVDNVANTVLVKGSHAIEYNTSSLNAGVYIYKLSSGTQSTTGKLIKK